jgi:glycosyltransferase involved in cell wall biosynthesis
MLDKVTPFILTYNEAPNIGRTLERLSWAREIVVVDSGSSDETLALVAQFPQARVVTRPFDCFANQANFALRETGIKTEWALALDADYLLTPELVEEIKDLSPPDTINGYRAGFVYCIYDKQLRGTAYPPVTVLYRREKAIYRQDGHAHRVEIKGAVGDLRSPIWHDDRKPLGRWAASQIRYAGEEAEKLAALPPAELSGNDRIRLKRYFAPFLVLFYCLFVKGNILDGRAGIFYAFQRMLAETLLSLNLLDADLQPEKSQVQSSKFKVQS